MIHPTRITTLLAALLFLGTTAFAQAEMKEATLLVGGEEMYPSKTIVAKLIKKGNGQATIPTVSGGTLTAMMNGTRNIVVQDENGNVANVVTYDVYQSNGVIHSIDTVLLPKS